jgi:hypothetical protein
MQSSKLFRNFEWKLRYLDSIRQRCDINDPFGSSFPHYDQFPSLDALAEVADNDDLIAAPIRQFIRLVDTLLLRVVVLVGQRELMTIRLQRWWRQHYYRPNGKGFAQAYNHFQNAIDHLPKFDPVESSL